MHPSEQQFHSHDGKITLRVLGSEAFIEQADTDPERVGLRGECLTAAIANNRGWVAAVLDGSMHRELYMYKRADSGEWQMLPLNTRLADAPQTLVWQEADDARYPPIELVATFPNGTEKRFPLR